MPCADLLIIGGGSSGAALAYEAVRRGLKVTLLEAEDPAVGTSSRSTKLLHGGVRYLELAVKKADPAQFKLVREALVERGHWIRQAPFLAHTLNLVLPTEGLIERSYYRLGLGFYDLMAGSAGLGPTSSLNAEGVQRTFPGLDRRFNGGVRYSDGQFNDARLNLLLLLTAARAGLEVVRDCRVVGFERTDGHLSAAISEAPGGEQQRWPARVIVNATGIAADQLRLLADPDAEARLLVSRGTHLVLKSNLCAGGDGLLIPRTSDGRVLFLLPFFGRTLLGTTDIPCPAAEATVVSDQERSYLLDHLARWFPDGSAGEVGSAWAGGRPLIRAAGSSASSSRLVREHEVEQLPSGLISLLGGKWTTCRVLALDALQLVLERLGGAEPVAQPLPLLGSAADCDQTVPQLQALRPRLLEQLPDHAQQAAQVDHLIASYGLRAEEVIHHAQQPGELEPLSEVVPICRAEWRFNIAQEWATTSSDLLSRRSRLALLDQQETARLSSMASELLLESGSTSPINHQQ